MAPRTHRATGPDAAVRLARHQRVLIGVGLWVAGAVISEAQRLDERDRRTRPSPVSGRVAEF